LFLAFQLSTESPAGAAGSINSSTIVCSPYNSYNEGSGPVGVHTNISAYCTISGHVATDAEAVGYWGIEYYTVWSQALASSTGVSSEASLYGIYYGMMEGTSGSADCSGSDTAITQDIDDYDYGAAEIDSEYTS